MSTATAGAARERHVRDHMIDHGWHLVARSAGSKGPADLVMVCPTRGLALVQVGTPGKTLGPADRARFLGLAELCGALPLVATVHRGIGIRYALVVDGPPSTWETWTHG